MKQKEKTKKRITAYGILLAVYVLASVVGIVLYGQLPGAWWQRLLVADVAATVVTFLFSLLFSNASVYDPYWSVQPLVILGAYAAAGPVSGLGVGILCVIGLWGIRLTANWAYTFQGMQHQDWRYTMLKEKTGMFYPLINFVGIHMVPTLIVYGCTLPAVYAVTHPAQWNVGAGIGCLLSLTAVVLQGTADVQMHRFRKNRTGSFIRRGLWKHSRHPNYLGEILMWWGVGLATVSAFPEAWYLLAGAAANTLLFLVVSIPMADGRQSAKPGFAEYKKQTRMLLPIPKH